MSNALVDNIGNASGSLTTPTQYVVRGSAKAWANLNGTGTIAPRDSLNVSSVVDNGTGDYSFNPANAMSTAAYGINAVAGDTVTNDIDTAFPNFAAPTASTLRGRTTNGAQSAARDAVYCNISISGDLA